MSTLFNNQATQSPFLYFIFNSNKSKNEIILITALAFIQFIILKYYYPFPSFIYGDSFSYLKAAQENSDINYYPIGYSKFLRLFNTISHSHYLLSAFQYLLIISSATFLVYTLCYFISTSKVLKFVLLGVISINPLFFFLGNTISSDGLFMAVSFSWFSTLIWLINRPSYKILILHCILLLVAFTIRYNALIYPLISFLAFTQSKMPIWKKTSGLCLSAFAIICFINYTSNQFKQLTGIKQFSPFSGWQLTNNAMYSYRYVKIKDRKDVKPKYKTLDDMIRQYYDSTRDTKKFPAEALEASTLYMWSDNMPMDKYQDYLFNNDTTKNDFKKWATLGPFYKEYGIYIIGLYPTEFVKHFILPNALKYYAPPVEFLGIYNSRRTTLNDETQKWFGLKNNKIFSRLKGYNIKVIYLYPILSGLFNVAFFLSIITYLLLTRWRNKSSINQIAFLYTSFWILNALFTITASSAALRFQAFQIFMTMIFSILLFDWIYRNYLLSKDSSHSDLRQPLELTNAL